MAGKLVSNGTREVVLEVGCARLRAMAPKIRARQYHLKAWFVTLCAWGREGPGC